MAVLYHLAGKLVHSSWFPPSTPAYAKLCISASATHTMTEEFFLNWLDQFYTELVALGIVFPIVLLLDNHSSHVTHAVAVKAKGYGIHLVGLPSNCTSVLQPLDAAVYAQFKIEWYSQLTLYVLAVSVRDLLLLLQL